MHCCCITCCCIIIWSEGIRSTLVDLIIYTLKNQQIKWNGLFYLLVCGIPTGGKHSVPIANILLSYIILSAIEEDPTFMSDIKLWARFIDDCIGLFAGTIQEFQVWFFKLQIVFRKFGLELTCDTDCYSFVNGEFIPKDTVKGVTFLDMDVFKALDTIHTKEHRKETSSVSYLPVHSAHAKHTFSGIVRSQLSRLRRICSLQEDFEAALDGLKERCLRSGYDEEMVSDILVNGRSLARILVPVDKSLDIDNRESVKLVVLAGTEYAKHFSEFARRINSTPHAKLRVNIVNTTGPTIGRLLFNNSNKCIEDSVCKLGSKCVVCPNEIQDLSGIVQSTVGKTHYRVGRELNCNDGGIYVVTGACSSQYTGKTVHFGVRMKEHLKTSKPSSVSDHMTNCNICYIPSDFHVNYVEHYNDRGKYSLSEREYLWDYRIKGSINLQKILKS